MADRKLFADQLPDDGSAGLVDVTTAWTTIGLWGPRAHPWCGHRGRRVPRGLPVRHVQDDRDRLAAHPRVADLPVGDLGWELYVPIEQGARLWDVLWSRAARTA